MAMLTYNMLLPFLFMFEIMQQLRKKHRSDQCQVCRAVFPLPALIRLVGHVTALLRPAIRGLGWVIWTRIMAEKHGGGDCRCVCSMST